MFLSCNTQRHFLYRGIFLRILHMWTVKVIALFHQSLDPSSSFSEIFFLRSYSSPDYSVSTISGYRSLSKTTEHIVTGKYSLNDDSFTKLIINGYCNLRSIVIESNSCSNVKQFNVSNCPSLMGIIVKNNCCNGLSGSFFVQKCDSLECILIGNNSFVTYDSFIIKGLKELVWLGIGTFNYEDGEQFCGVEKVYFESWID